ncbi:MAG TPA: M20/M25/M40 family metallo-hydrolase [Nocardioidaceae bacterium]|nr:M20/M25/M40 family metallo-hydrolase [Nocardioidaceae bacterium]
MTATAYSKATTDEVIDLCSRLIRFDTQNFGGGESHGERACAEWIAEQLSEVGYTPVVVESEPTRASTVVRIAGADPAADALLVHGHIDVVPANAADWSVDPFGGEVIDGAIWGRGALDMKDMVAMMLAIARSFARTGTIPPRDIVLAFVADEEDTGDLGAGFLAREHADLLEGVRTAIGESGGSTVHLPDGSRLYPIATGERGSAWMNLTARGIAGHGSRPSSDNAVATLVDALARLAAYDWPPSPPAPVRRLIDGLEAHLGVQIDIRDPATLAKFGDAARLVRPTLANSLNPTMLQAGYKHNVIPSEAVGGVDGRIVPGAEDEFFSVVDSICGSAITRDFANHSSPVSADHDSAEFAAMADALRTHDPEAVVLPFCMGGGTDAKQFSQLDIACYGFAPGRTPVGFNPDEYVHGVDEHVPVDSLVFGTQVLETYLRSQPGTMQEDDHR